MQTTATKTVIAPTVHLNGDARAVLLEQIENAMQGIRDAGKAFRETCPNARNYYVVNPQAFERARDEYQSRGERLQSVLDELEAIYCAIVDGKIEAEIR